ncbi:hypothetical protein B0H11DRAFT_1910395 [Mycena galericulata]|nr:hypothetical protein B0H11DRAFT_1910395 [Mycena galericulata]
MVNLERRYYTHQWGAIILRFRWAIEYTMSSHLLDGWSGHRRDAYGYVSYQKLIRMEGNSNVWGVKIPHSEGECSKGSHNLLRGFPGWAENGVESVKKFVEGVHSTLKRLNCAVSNLDIATCRKAPHSNMGTAGPCGPSLMVLVIEL